LCFSFWTGWLKTDGAVVDSASDRRPTFQRPENAFNPSSFRAPSCLARRFGIVPVVADGDGDGDGDDD
jgi:hypothetical protein